MRTPNDSITAEQNIPSTGTSSSQYWVTRVVEQMKGCSPSRIDSVIQANLPPVKIRWSQRLDTLEIPGLEGRKAYSADSIPNCYELGYFQQYSLFYSEVKLPITNTGTGEKPYTLQNDSIVGCMLLLCVIALSVTISRTRIFLQTQWQNFLNNKRCENLSDIQKTAGVDNMIIAYILLSVSGSILYYSYAQSHFNLFMLHLPQHLLLGIYVPTIALFLCGQRILVNFTNWIFFDKTSRQEWSVFYNFHIILNTSILLIVLIVAIYSDFSTTTMLNLSFAAVFLLKITLLYKVYTIFSFKIYGILHLLSYLCALEMLPLMGLWVLLTNITNSLV
jgi:hypothetical protein